MNIPLLRIGSSLGLWLATLIAAGCYRLGPIPPPEYSSLAVPEFRLGKNVFKPRLQTPVTSAVIRRLQADGAIAIADSSEADAILEGEITGYDLQPLRFQQVNAVETREYRLVLTATVTVRKRGSQEILLRADNVQGETSFFILGDLTTAEHQALPLAADDLARHIVQIVGEGW